MLFWALAGGAGAQGVREMIHSPLPNLLCAIALDLQALAELAKTSRKGEVKALGASLDTLHRRIATAAEISRRDQEMKEDDG
jgi:hypothetical protein